jgi:hypothetical protein
VRRLLIALGILVVLLVVVDRVAVAVADRAVANQIRTELELQQTPSVSIHGFPFLPQAVRGRYDDVAVRIPDVDSGRLHNVQVDARLRDVRAPLDRVVSGGLDEVPVRDVSGSLAVRYEDLARASEVPGLRITPSGDGLRVSGVVEVAGRRVEASARATVTVVDGDLLVTADQAEVGGVELPAVALATAAQLLSFRVSPRSLPLALRITGVHVGTESLSVDAQAHNVVLRRDEISVTR